MNRTYLAELIFNKISNEKERISKQYFASKDKIGYFYIDGLLPEEIAQQIDSYFPEKTEMTRKNNLRENKYVGAQMNKYHSFLEELIYAFQDNKVVGIIKDICSIKSLYPDENLYAGGISSMSKDQFLNPHLDNSHDKDRDKWRVLNLLYYVTPNWEKKYGGHLELWPDGTSQSQITIHSLFNRLVVMCTHQSSWHSVSPVQVDRSRNCVSNYYFSDFPLLENDSFHVTSFKGRPGQYIANQILQLDSFIRMTIRKVFKKGIRENPHVYKKED